MIDRAKLAKQYEEELECFEELHPKSRAFYERARSSLLQGVPMNWMVRWAGKYPIHVAEASGSRLTCVDGHEYIDLCLGDTGSMVGHSPEPVLRAMEAHARRGFTYMLPTGDAALCAEALGSRFGVPYWQFTTSATDANRFALRLARMVTGRPKVLVYNWCYHGSVDESFATLDGAGHVCARGGNIGPPVDPVLTTRIVEFNDAEALEAALGEGDVAAVLAEPAMTNIGIVHPVPGYHDALRVLTKKYGTLLILDETHTICTGVGGYTGAFGLKPDIVTLGKTIASGIPAGAYGMSEEFASRVAASIDRELCDTGGIGGTLAANALTLAVMRVVLSEVLTQAFYDHTLPLAQRFSKGVAGVIEKHALPWNTTTLGCRTEYWFSPRPAVNGSQAAASTDPLLDAYMHLAGLNRGILMTPFHNMALLSAQTDVTAVDRHTEVFRELVENII